MLIHGFTQTVASWGAVTHGLRQVGIEPNACTIPQRATFDATVDALAAQHKRGLWCGYSMGGRLALFAALNHPELVQHLMLVSATAGIESAAERTTRRAADAELARSALANGTEAFLNGWLAQPMFARVAADAPGIVERSALRPQRLAHDLQVLGTGSMPNAWGRLAELHMPVTIVTGTHDKKFTAIGERMHQRIANSRLIHVDSGHAIPLEQPQRLATIIHETHNAPARNNDETN